MLILTVTCADEGSCLAQILDHLLMQPVPLHSHGQVVAADVIWHSLRVAVIIWVSQFGCEDAGSQFHLRYFLFSQVEQLHQHTIHTN